MTSLLKKALLTTVFGSVGFVAGCGHAPKQQDAPKADTPHYFTETEVTGIAQTVFDERGETITQHTGCTLTTPANPDNGSWAGTQDTCNYDIEKKQDDGVIVHARFHAQDKKLVFAACDYRPNDPVADREQAAIIAAFNRDARKKFAKMGFTVLDTFDDPASKLDISTGPVECRDFMSATFLLKQDGRLYSAELYESFGFPGIDPSGTLVKNLETVDRATAAGKAAAAAANAAPEDDNASSPPPDEERHQSSSSGSKLCVGACIGPHIDLQTGKIKMYGTGPGLKF